MILLRFIVFLFVCSCIIAFCDQQYIRYNQFIVVCENERKSDLLLTSHVCKDTRLKIQHECDVANHRLRLSINECARSKLLNDSELVRLWLIMTDSYIRILGFILPTTLVFIYYLVGGWFDERKQNNYMKRQSDFIDKFYLNSPQHQQHKMIGNNSRKKRKTYSARERIQILDDDDFDDYA